jgi:hypothetical protein
MMITVNLPDGNRLLMSDLQALVLLSELIPDLEQSDKITFNHKDVLRMVFVLENFFGKKGLPSLIENYTVADVVSIVQQLVNQFVENVNNPTANS